MASGGDEGLPGLNDIKAWVTRFIDKRCEVASVETSSEAMMTAWYAWSDEYKIICTRHNDAGKFARHIWNKNVNQEYKSISKKIHGLKLRVEVTGAKIIGTEDIERALIFEQFRIDCLYCEVSTYTSTADLYRGYNEWCKANNYRFEYLSQQSFSAVWNRIHRANKDLAIYAAMATHSLIRGIRIKSKGLVCKIEVVEITKEILDSNKQSDEQDKKLTPQTNLYTANHQIVSNPGSPKWTPKIKKSVIENGIKLIVREEVQKACIGENGLKIESDTKSNMKGNEINFKMKEELLIQIREEANKDTLTILMKEENITPTVSNPIKIILDLH